MKQSKVIFGVIAAIVAIAVIVVIAISSGSKPEAPSTSGGTQVAPSTGEPSLEVPSTGGNDATEPSTTNPAPTDPSATEPSSTVTIPGWLKPFISTGTTEPPAPEVPKYEEMDLPASSGYHYNNDKSVSIAVDYERYGLKELKISFGTGVSGTKQYIALNPHVEIVSSQGAVLPDRFQYYFMPSNGYVTTITDAEYSSYKDTCNSTFRRAMDYALSSDYISDELPGTIWYMGAGEKAAAPYVDVLVYNFGDMVATLRLNFAKDNSGRYYLESIENRNQLDSDCSDQKLPQSMIDWLLIHSEDFLTEEYKVKKAYSVTDFIIERRAVGQSTYFDYSNWLAYVNNMGDSKEVYMNVELYAVTYRFLDRGSYHRPVTFYYIFTVEDGIDNYIRVGIDNPDTYNLKTLISAGWPGYVEDPEDSWFLNPDF